jgi:hypothetical protein
MAEGALVNEEQFLLYVKHDGLDQRLRQLLAAPEVRRYSTRVPTQRGSCDLRAMRHQSGIEAVRAARCRPLCATRCRAARRSMA